MMKWIYTAMIRPIMSYACVSWAGGLNKKYLVRKLTKVQRLACLMISSAFPGTPTGALEILLKITPIEEFLLAEAVRGSYRISVSGLWHVNPIGSFGKTKSHVDVCNEARRFLPLLQMPADRIKKTKVFERNFECQIMDNKNAIRFESVLNQNTVKVYTDGSKLDGRVGASFYAEYPNNSPKTSIFSPWNLQHCVPGKSLSYFRNGKEPALGKKCTIKILLCWLTAKQLSKHS